MLNFPVPYTEELLYSTVARAGVRQALISPKQLLDEVFESRSVTATIDLPNHLSSISRWLPREFTPEKLIYDHTLFPLYAPFIPEARRLQCIKWLYIAARGAIHLALGVAASRIKTPRFIRYCPGCVMTQRKQHGEYFWLREWQAAGIESCPEHGELVDTPIARPLIERHRFIAAAPEHCPLVRQQKGTAVSDGVTDQVRELLTLPAQSSPSYEQWTAYYHALANRLGLCRGIVQVDHASIRDRVLQVWPVIWLMKHHLMFTGSSGTDESDWLRAIFRTHRKSFSYLQHIVVHEALLGAGWHLGDVLKEVRCYPARGRPQPSPVVILSSTLWSSDQDVWLGLLLSHSPMQARKTSPALYARLYRNLHDWLLAVNQRHADNKTNIHTRRVDWDKRDRECLRALRQWATVLRADQRGPRRSRTLYLKLLGHHSTIERNLHKMPRSATFLSVYPENVAKYQVRRLRNTYDDLRRCFDAPPRWRLLRNANLSEERLTEPARVFLENLLGREHEFQRCGK